MPSDSPEIEAPPVPQSVTEQMTRSIRALRKATFEKKVQIMIKAKLIPPEQVDAALAKARAFDAHPRTVKIKKSRRKAGSK